jgi:uncharacterized protein YndB with AHSA1/START domain
MKSEPIDSPATEPIAHTSFVIQRSLPGRPAHAFRFWSEPALKARWNECHADWRVVEDRVEFRVGGLEAKRWQTPDGAEQSFHAHYLDIAAPYRLIYAYEMSFAGSRVSASLVTIELEADGAKTRMTYTEQVAMIAGGDAARDQRLAGTEEGLDRLIAVMQADEVTFRN